MILVLALWACAPETGACDRMCDLAEASIERCQAQEALDWAAYGYDDADDFARACATWAWEEELLTGDAEAECADRTETLDPPSCESFRLLTW